MGETFEPLDSLDAEAVAEGAIDPDDARPVDVSDTVPGLDSERPMFSGGPSRQRNDQDAESVNGLDMSKPRTPQTSKPPP